MSNHAATFDRDVARIMKILKKRIPADINGNALILVAAELIRVGIEQMPLEDQPHAWAAVIADMQDHMA